MKYSVRTLTTAATMMAFASTGLAGCASLSNTERGAVIGATTGAAVGGALGQRGGSTAKGAIIGAAVGGAAGAIIGRQMDRQREEIDQTVPGATTERVGEGIYIRFDSGILFDTDQAQLLGAGRTNLTRLAESLRRYPESEVLIVGHTDARGSDSHNYALSQRRSASARSYLIQQGVAANRIRTEGRGKTEPIATNETAAGMQQNRRVEVAIFASPEYRERVRRETGTR
ncbi:MAG: OmpA family protein [Gemmatimonadota bacterium]|nr:OmpA family protein [Gemmatimonadota bacterium]